MTREVAFHGSTPARNRALWVVRTAPNARISNVTSLVQGTVYWQSAEWLLSEGMVEHVPTDREHLRLTDKGLKAFSRLVRLQPKEG